jgi:DNA helicase-2/ATP-dependent DNA helicase PcrA
VGSRPRHGSDSESVHFNYEDESQEIPRSLAPSSSPYPGSAPRGKSAGAPPQAGGPDNIANIARFFGSKSGSARPGTFARPAMDIPPAHGASGLKKGQHVLHSKYGEGTVLVREGDGEDAKLTVLFARHGVKKLMEKFANLKKI